MTSKKHHDHTDAHDPNAVQDPVCKHWILPEWAVATSAHGGQTIHFCRTVCKESFDADPDRFVTA